MHKLEKWTNEQPLKLDNPPPLSNKNFIGNTHSFMSAKSNLMEPKTMSNSDRFRIDDLGCLSSHTETFLTQDSTTCPHTSPKHHHKHWFLVANKPLMMEWGGLSHTDITKPLCLA